MKIENGKLKIENGGIKVITLLLLMFPLVSLADERVRILSYNVENYFDTEKDSIKDDVSFTPDGDHYWSYTKFRKKSVNIAKVIAAAGEWQGAAIVGLYEVENDYVLNTLVKYSPLESRRYKYIHYESLDPRGIDVAMLYDPQRVDVLESKPIRVVCGGDTMRTRDILYAKTLLLKSDTLHLFLCHTPSRRGGVEASSWKRECVMSIVRQKSDSINSHHDTNILIMGDFNDFPDCKSICETLGAVQPNEVTDAATYYNMFWKYQKEGRGTYKYSGEWNMLDQIIVSGSMLQSQGIHTSQENAVIFDAGFIMKDDTKFFGSKPLRTYNGRRYIGGYSDHLPIYIDLFLNKEK